MIPYSLISAIDTSEHAVLKQANNKKILLKKIEEILSHINESAEMGQAPKLVIRNQRLWSNCIYDLDR